MAPKHEQTPACDQLIADARGCMLCPRMVGSRRVLSAKNGDFQADVMFVAEAPGRLGAEVTGIPLFGDRTGDRFQELLVAMNWNRSRLFITNAVICNPRDEQGNNDLPKAQEIRNCSRLLQRTVELVNPLLLIALGRVALNALSLIDAHQIELSSFAGRVVPWNSRHLGILYHPGPRTQVHRKWHKQLEDAKAVARFASDVLGINMGPPREEGLFRESESRMKLAGD